MRGALFQVKYGGPIAELNPVRQSAVLSASSVSLMLIGCRGSKPSRGFGR